MQAHRFPFRLGLFALVASQLSAQVWEVHNSLLTLQSGPVQDALYGDALAVGDFDGDGYDDLAVGTRSGLVVEVYRGGATGLGASPWKVFLGGESGSEFGAALAAGDFDGDGRDELVVAAPSAAAYTPSYTASAGAVYLFQFESGVWVSGAVFNQASAGIPGDAEANDHLGEALATGDFDGDGYDDLAVGVPYEAVGATSFAGAVNVIYGGSSGLSSAGAQLWYRSGGGIDGVADGAFLGSALAAGDFDSDGYDDLAIGAPFTTIASEWATGDVVVLYGGSSAGLAAAGQQRFDPTTLGATANGQEFGASLAAADFSRSSTCLYFLSCADDLAIGAPHETVLVSGSPVSTAGAVYTIFGSPILPGLDVTSHDRITQSSLTGTGSPSEYGDYFGVSLASGDLDRRAGAELVVGASGEAFDGIGEAGAADVLFGGSANLDGTDREFLWSRSGLLSAPQLSPDGFGAALAIGDFDGNGTGDLAIGLIQRSLAGKANAGAVQVLYGALFADGFESSTPNNWSNY